MGLLRSIAWIAVLMVLLVSVVDLFFGDMTLFGFLTPSWMGLATEHPELFVLGVVIIVFLFGDEAADMLDAV